MSSQDIPEQHPLSERGCPGAVGVAGEETPVFGDFEKPRRSCIPGGRMSPNGTTAVGRGHASAGQRGVRRYPEGGRSHSVACARSVGDHIGPSGPSLHSRRIGVLVDSRGGSLPQQRDLKRAGRSVSRSEE